MKSRRAALFVLMTIGVLLSACRKPVNPVTEPPAPPTAPVTTHPDDVPAVDQSVPSNVTVSWSATAKKISHNIYSAEYGRVKKLGGDTLLLTYHGGAPGNEWDNVILRKSYDGGATWADAEILMEDNSPNYYGFANPDLYILQNGWIILAFNGRGNPDVNANNNVQIRISKDRAKTWEAPKIIATGRSWEPAMLQYSDGELQVFYSSEARWWAGIGTANVQQEILMVSSKDNGSSWSVPKQVAYTNGFRDGMATPLILKDNKGIVFPIESVGNAKSPWIVWSSMSARWNYKSAGAVENERRWLATPQNIWGGAPYMIQLQSGETILSVQDAGGRNIGSNWKKSTMLVLVGNSMAKNFTNVSTAWPNLPVDEGAYYSSLYVKDSNRLVMVSTNNFADGHSEIWWKEGTINR